MSLVIGHSSLVIPRRRRGGFALLITITLLAFLVLLLVSLASLTRVETQVAANNQDIARARQNALLALNIALGQLQKHTGPDQRVTSRADLILPPGVTITPPTFNFTPSTTVNGGKFTSPGSTGETVLTDVNAYWANPATPRNRHWTAAWLNTNTSAFDRNDPVAFNPIPGRFLNDDPAQPDSTPVWLVSGSESATTFHPANPVTGLTLATTAITDTLVDSVANVPHRLLVGPGTTGNTALQNYVTAPQMPLLGTVPGLTGDQTVGNYAWWIGDEGIKARADLLDPYGPVAGTVPASPDAPRNLKRRQSAQRPAIEAMTIDPADTDANAAGLAPFFTDLAADTRLRNLVAASQFPFLDDDTAFRTQLDRRYHDLSITSRGVLADTKNGGLRRDLTHILSRPTAADFRTALNSGGFNVAPAATYNLALTSAATPYATIPSNEPSGRAYDAGTGILANSTPWEHLWSFYNLREPVPLGVFSGATAVARPARGDQLPLYPLLVQAKLFYALEVNGGAVTLRITPIAVLANPYNVPLSGDFILRFSGPTPAIVSGTLSDPPPDPDDLVYTNNNPATEENQFRRRGDTLPNGGLANISLVLRATSIPPGVAQIFSVDPSANRIIAGPTDTRDVSMINTYDPTVFLTYATGRSIDTAAGHTHAALFATGMSAALYIGDLDAENRISSIGTKSPDSSTGAPIEAGFIVYPFESGYRRGGGIFFAIQDGKARPQQAMFYQLNYRALLNDYVGSSSYHDHPLQWGTSYAVRGTEGDTDTGPHPLLSANILAPLDEAIPATTRWGLVGSGEYPSLTTPPPEVAIDASFVNRLYDIPTPDAPITSLGQLQHLNLAGHFSATVANNESVKTNSFLVNYPIGNSYPGPRVRRHKVFHSSTPYSHHYDASYIWNDLLWDRFTFSSYPQSGAFTFGPDETGHLVNSRYRPFRPATVTAPDDEASFRGVFEPARNLLVNGAFNINSTSVEAWKAVLSSLKGIPTGTEASPSAPFSRTLSPGGGSADARSGVSANAWNGFTNLTQAEINELAEEIVLQIRLRGPFLSLAEFVNRRLIQGPSVASNAGHPDPHRLGLSGALQSAIDRAVNRKAPLPPLPYALASERNAGSGTRDGNGTPLHGFHFPDLEYRMHTRIAGYPGYLLQADVLSALAPNLSARSDTFTIRTYGDVNNPATDTVTARAWCEAVVQRLPDYIDPAATAAEATPAPGTPNATFGRRYQIISFRWLTPDDI